jgi:hypothetical protein
MGNIFDYNYLDDISDATEKVIKKLEENEFDHINRSYQLEVELGSKVIYLGGQDPINGEVVGAKFARLIIKLENGKVAYYHPTWKLKYLKKELKDA